MIKVTVTNIKYDVDHGSDGKRLPKKLTFDLDYDYDLVMQDKANGRDLSDIEDEISDKISDDTGFCHQGFNYTIDKA